MKILGLDSSGLVASVAIVCDNNMLGEYTVNYKKTHSQTLLPMLDEVAKMIELDLNSIGSSFSYASAGVSSPSVVSSSISLKFLSINSFTIPPMI